MRVKVLYFERCPTYRSAEMLLQEVLAEVGIEAEVDLVAEDTNEEAQRLRFVGSLTIRVDGMDLFLVEDRTTWRYGAGHT